MARVETQPLLGHGVAGGDCLGDEVGLHLRIILVRSYRQILRRHILRLYLLLHNLQQCRRSLVLLQFFTAI